MSCLNIAVLEDGVGELAFAMFLFDSLGFCKESIGASVMFPVIAEVTGMTFCELFLSKTTTTPP